MNKVELENDALARRGIAVIKDGQSPAGAYIASPNFSQYGFCWLRDGSYCALAMQAVGQWASAWRFHAWVASAVGARLAGVDAPGQARLPARYRLDGTPEPAQSGWANFQLDGYGTWLFTLYDAVRLGPSSSEIDAVLPVAVDVADYIAASWRLPCFDYWEETADRLHTSTLAALAAGLRAAARLTGQPGYDATAGEIVAFMRERCVAGGGFVKAVGDARVDGALLSLGVPFGLVGLDDPLFQTTLGRIRAELSSPSGGGRRYVGDSYYGGGPWVLLTAWLGWCDRLIGDDPGCARARDWVRAHAGPDGTLPEQVIDEPQAPDMVGVWLDRWGPVADPLLWSHAKYLLLLAGREVPPWS